MPVRFQPLDPRGVKTVADAVSYARSGQQLIATALAGPIIVDWGALAGNTTLDIQIADVNLLKLSASITNLTFKTMNAPDRTVVRVEVSQDATGNRTITNWVNVTWPSATAPTLSTGAKKVDVFEFTYMATLSKWFGRTLALNY